MGFLGDIADRIKAEKWKRDAHAAYEKKHEPEILKERTALFNARAKEERARYKYESARKKNSGGGGGFGIASMVGDSTSMFGSGGGGRKSSGGGMSDFSPITGTWSGDRSSAPRRHATRHHTRSRPTSRRGRSIVIKL